jgi:uncharacterized membrane protein
VFESTTPIKVEARSALIWLIITIVVALAAMVSIAFIGIAVFVGTFNAYGAVSACVAEIAYLLVIAAIAVCVILVSRNRGRKRAARRSEEEAMAQRRRFAQGPPLWKDKGVIAAALPILTKAAQLAVRYKGPAGLLVGGAALGWSVWHAMREPRMTAPDAQNPA